MSSPRLPSVTRLPQSMFALHLCPFWRGIRNRLAYFFFLSLCLCIAPIFHKCFPSCLSSELRGRLLYQWLQPINTDWLMTNIVYWSIHLAKQSKPFKPFLNIFFVIESLYGDTFVYHAPCAFLIFSISADIHGFHPDRICLFKNNWSPAPHV